MDRPQQYPKTTAEPPGFRTRWNSPATRSRFVRPAMCCITPAQRRRSTLSDSTGSSRRSARRREVLPLSSGEARAGDLQALYGVVHPDNRPGEAGQVAARTAPGVKNGVGPANPEPTEGDGVEGAVLPSEVGVDRVVLPGFAVADLTLQEDISDISDVSCRAVPGPGALWLRQVLSGSFRSVLSGAPATVSHRGGLRCNIIGRGGCSPADRRGVSGIFAIQERLRGPGRAKTFGRLRETPF